MLKVQKRKILCFVTERNFEFCDRDISKEQNFRREKFYCSERRDERLNISSLEFWKKFGNKWRDRDIKISQDENFASCEGNVRD